MTNRVIIPSTVDDAVDQLGGLHRLIQAREWERAAIVFAFTRDDAPKAHRVMDRNNHERMSFREFAEQGISGLTTHVTVARYHRAWATTGNPVRPGQVVNLSGLGPFPPDDQITDPDRRTYLNDSAEAEGAGTQSTQQIATHLPAMKAAIKGDSKVAAAARAALDEVHDEFVAGRPASIEPQQDNARNEYADALTLMVKLRAAHRALEHVVSMAHNIRGLGADDLREGVLAEVDWIRGACSIIETGANGGPLDEQIAEFMDAEAGR
jgi:hypothetical protein